MIRALRSRHRWMTAGMGLVALAGLGAGVARRAPPAVMAQLPSVLRSAPAAGGADVRPAGPLRWAGDDSWLGARLRTEVYSDAVQLTVLEPLRRPDPLLYWSPAPSGADSALPDGAVLLGRVLADPAPQRFRLPPRAEGALLLFSLAHGEVFASLSLAPKERS